MASSNLSAARNLQTSDLGPSFSNPYMIFNLASGWGTDKVKHRYVSGYFTGNYTYDRLYSLSGSWRIDKTDLFGADPKYRGRPLWWWVPAGTSTMKLFWLLPNGLMF